MHLNIRNTFGRSQVISDSNCYLWCNLGYVFKLFMKTVIKQILKSVSDGLGLELSKKGVGKSSNIISRMYDIRSSLGDALMHVRSLGFYPETVFDVGVGYGTPELYDVFAESRTILIEPLKEFEHNLKKISRRYGAEYVLAAAGANPGKSEIGVSPDLCGSSMLRNIGKKREIDVVTLDGLSQAGSLKAPFLVKVDVQGTELDVLNGADTVLKETELVILEVSFFRFRAECPEFYDVIDYMMKRGFVVYEIFGGHNRPLDGAIACVVNGRTSSRISEAFKIKN